MERFLLSGAPARPLALCERDVLRHPQRGCPSCVLAPPLLGRILIGVRPLPGRTPYGCESVNVTAKGCVLFLLMRRACATPLGGMSGCECIRAGRLLSS
jgi:hypothetical protein